MHFTANLTTLTRALGRAERQPQQLTSTEQTNHENPDLQSQNHHGSSNLPGDPGRTRSTRAKTSRDDPDRPTPRLDQVIPP